MSAVFEKIVKEPAYKRVSSAIEQKIMTRTLLPGDTLPSEMQLADQFGLNRSTVREGLRQLEISGLIERRNNGKRLFVSRPSRGDVAEGVSKAMALHDVTFQEVWEAMMILEPHAAALAAERASPEQLDTLKGAVEALDAPNIDNDGAVECAVNFFKVLSENTNNQVLMMSLAPLSLLLRPSLKIMIGELSQARSRILEAQKHILKACQDRDPDHAREWMQKHIDDFKRGYILAGIALDRVVL